MKKSNSNTNHDNATGKKIKSIRKAHKLTQVQVADEMECGQSAISQMELGTTPISHDLICTMSDLTGIDHLIIDEHFLKRGRFAKDRKEFLPSRSIYVLHNSTIGYVKIGISNDPLARSKQISNKSASPGHFRLVSEWAVGERAKDLEKNALIALLGKGYTVDHETVDCTPQVAVDTIQSLVESPNNFL